MRALSFWLCLSPLLVLAACSDEASSDPVVEPTPRVDYDYEPPSDAVNEIFASHYTYPYQDCVDLEEGHGLPEESVTLSEDGTEQVCVAERSGLCSFREPV